MRWSALEEHALQDMLAGSLSSLVVADQGNTRQTAELLLAARYLEHSSSRDLASRADVAESSWPKALNVPTSRSADPHPQLACMCRAGAWSRSWSVCADDLAGQAKQVTSVHNVSHRTRKIQH